MQIGIVVEFYSLRKEGDYTKGTDGMVESVVVNILYYKITYAKAQNSRQGHQEEVVNYHKSAKLKRFLIGHQ